MIAIPCIKVFLCGTALAWWKGDWVWCVSLVPCRLRGWKSIVRKIRFDFYIALHYVGVPLQIYRNTCLTIGRSYSNC